MVFEEFFLDLDKKGSKVLPLLLVFDIQRHFPNQKKKLKPMNITKFKQQTTLFSMAMALKFDVS